MARQTPLRRLPLVWLPLAAFVVIHATAAAAAGVSGVYFFQDASCEVPGSLPGTSFSFLPLTNTNAGMPIPFPGGSMEPYDCVNMICLTFQYQWLSSPPASYSPSAESVRSCMGWSTARGGSCTSAMTINSTCSTDLQCFGFGGGVYAAIDCFGLIAQFPPIPIASAVSSSSSTGISWTEGRDADTRMATLLLTFAMKMDETLAESLEEVLYELATVLDVSPARLAIVDTKSSSGLLEVVLTILPEADATSARSPSTIADELARMNQDDESMLTRGKRTSALLPRYGVKVLDANFE